jgi:acetyl esterase/lipase
MASSLINAVYRRKHILLLLYLVLGIIACGNTMSIGSPSVNLHPILKLPPSRGYRVTTKTDIAYGPLPDEALDLCLPIRAALAEPAPLPGIILIHGGGWIGGDKHTYSSLCSSLASWGFIVAAINYRLAPEHIWPAQLIDAQLAVRWLRSQADLIRLDSRKLCAYGISAGAHLSIFLGTLDTIHSGDEAGVLASESPKVSCVVDEFGPTNPSEMLNTAYQQHLVHALLGGTSPQSDPAIYRDASPLFEVTMKSAPMLIIQGTQDTIVPPGQSLELRLKLQQAHIPVQYISYVGDHSYKGLNQGQKDSIQGQIFAFLMAQEHP